MAVVSLQRIKGQTFPSDDGKIGVRIGKHPIVLLGYCVLGAAVTLGLFLGARWLEAAMHADFSWYGYVPGALVGLWFLWNFYDLAGTFLLVTRARVYTFETKWGVPDPADYALFHDIGMRRIDWTWGPVGWLLRMADITFTVAGDIPDVAFTKAVYTLRTQDDLARLLNDAPGAA